MITVLTSGPIADVPIMRMPHPCPIKAIYYLLYFGDITTGFFLPNTGPPTYQTVLVHMFNLSHGQTNFLFFNTDLTLAINFVSRSTFHTLALLIHM